MNKTVTINISGIIFHIEEDAYDALSKYLSAIKGYFSSTDGGSEIMSDIEARIAELLKEKVSDYKQVVLMTDVEHVMNVMGMPEDFADEGTREQSTKQEENYQYYTGGKRRRLFRDTDAKIAGGVCAGIANHFDFDPLWMRIVLVALVLMSAGILIPLYIILWVIIPEAKTTAEKLEMHGDPIDINNISKSIKEEANQTKDRMRKFGKRMKEERSGEKLADGLKELIGLVFKIISKFIGAILVLFGATLMIGVVIMLVHKLSVNGSDAELYMDDFFSEHKSLTLLGLVILFGIPATMFLYKGIKMLFGIKYHNRWINLSAGLIWIVGIVITLTGVISVFKEFEEEGKSKTAFVVAKPKMDTLFISADTNNKLMDQFDSNKEERGLGKFKIHFMDKSCKLLDVKGKKIIYGVPQLQIVDADTDSIEVNIIKYASGKEKKEAMDRAKNITYSISQIDSLLILNPLFNLAEGEKLRNQEVIVQIKVPRGVVVKLDKSLLGYLSDVDNVSNTWDNDMVGRRWIMTKYGLQCIDCEGLDLDEERSIAHPVIINENGIKVNDKDANVEIDKNGINIKSKDANVKIDKHGINVKTKNNKEEVLHTL